MNVEDSGCTLSVDELTRKETELHVRVCLVLNESFIGCVLHISSNDCYENVAAILKHCHLLKVLLLRFKKNRYNYFD